MLCPTCKIQLTIADRQGVEIDYCPTCRGVWLDRGELDKLIERSMGDDRRPGPTEHRGAGVPYGAGRPVDFDDDDDRYAGRGGRRRKGWLGELLDFG
ncbi:MAG: zf-TFIIB domain-containing protein [Chloroflexota bacterium]